MACSSSQRGGELILAASHGLPIAAYDALTGDVVAEFPAANTPRHGLAVAAGPGTAIVAASHVCPATGAGSIRLLRWWSPAPAHELPVPEPVAPLVATPYGSHLLAGGVSGRVHAVALPSGDVACSLRAHTGGAVSCLALNDDGSLLVSGGDNGGVAVFPLLSVLDVDAANNASTDLAVYRIAAHVAPVTCVACGHGGSNAVVASASTDGTCKVWRLADGSHLRTLSLPCTVLSIALDPTSFNLYAGGSDGRIHVASLNSPGSNTVKTTPQHATNSTNDAALIGVAIANECKNLVSCSEDGEVRVWDLTHGLLLANTFWIRGAVSGVVVVKRLPGELVRGGGEGFRVHDDVAWTRTREVAEMNQMLRSSEEDKARSVELIEMNVDNYKRCLRLVLREVNAVANGRRNGIKDGNVSD
ncbi:protein ROOT INITIATION DEFECTIVE 3-like [Phragmites australis]|uniref:protein ROOT INITIATION DEFECTIVE 3-like n=1 Tax=Phragmites australis TaxID=29695 RepID=UPI002D764CF2|nr:protein ROOT INITIATION DEFECTIVE 3-like [Phragmites australis]